MPEYLILVHDGLVQKGRSADLFQFEDRRVWLPHERIENVTDETVWVEKWLAVKEELEGYEV